MFAVNLDCPICATQDTLQAHKPFTRVYIRATCTSLSCCCSFDAKLAEITAMLSRYNDKVKEGALEGEGHHMPRYGAMEGCLQSGFITVWGPTRGEWVLGHTYGQSAKVEGPQE